jgi:sulfide:quinone oxidoreductase
MEGTTRMKKKILILGGGFAGVQAAIELQKKEKYEVTLVSERDYFFLYPTSIWIPTRATTFEKTRVPLADIQKKYPFRLIIDTVQEIRSSSNTVRCAHRTLTYDYVIVAVGAEKVLLPGQEHTLSICGKPEMSLAIRDEIDRVTQKGSGKIAIGFSGNPKDTSAVRGGPAFELIFNIHTLLEKKGIRKNFELTLFAPMEHPGIRMGKKALTMIDDMFSRYGIKKRYGKKIKSFYEGGIVFADDSVLESDFTMFIPGTSGHHILAQSDLPLNDAGFVRIDDHMLVEGTTNVYAVGDSAALQGPDWMTKQGHTAEVMARHAVYNIDMAETGNESRKGYRSHLAILCILDTGNGAAFVYRDERRNIVIPMPIVGHWLKQGWGWYAKLTKLGKVPRVPGL